MSGDARRWALHPVNSFYYSIFYIFILSYSSLFFLLLLNIADITDFHQPSIHTSPAHPIHALAHLRIKRIPQSSHSTPLLSLPIHPPLLASELLLPFSLITRSYPVHPLSLTLSLQYPLCPSLSCTHVLMQTSVDTSTCTSPLPGWSDALCSPPRDTHTPP